MMPRHLMMRVLNAASLVDCALGVFETLGRRGSKSCDDLLVVICFPKNTALDYV